MKHLRTSSDGAASIRVRSTRSTEHIEQGLRCIGAPVHDYTRQEVER